MYLIFYVVDVIIYYWNIVLIINNWNSFTLFYSIKKYKFWCPFTITLSPYSSYISPVVKLKALYILATYVA